MKIDWIKSHRQALNFLNIETQVLMNSMIEEIDLLLLKTNKVTSKQLMKKILMGIDQF